MSSDSEDGIFVMLAWQKLFFKNTERQFWVDPFLKEREEKNVIIEKIQKYRNYPAKFKNYTRMSINLYDKLLNMVHEKIKKCDTNYRKSVTPNEKLFVTLRYLATGESFTSLHHQFLLGVSTIQKFVPEVCQAIWEVLCPIYMQTPNSQTWATIAKEFEELWDFPHCIGAVDGKHIRIECPPNAGSEYFNYKNYHSIVLQAVADAKGNFICVDVGDYGRNGDSSVFNESLFGKVFKNGNLQIPSPAQLENKQNSFQFPYILVGDEAYPLAKNLMKPFARKNLTKEKRIFNYRLSRARRLVECAFGMITKKFRVIDNKMLLLPDNAKKVTMAVCVLHNFIRQEEGKFAEVRAMLDNLYEETNNEENQRNNQRISNYALLVRQQFMEYFVSSEGAIAWQWKYA